MILWFYLDHTREHWKSSNFCVTPDIHTKITTSSQQLFLKAEKLVFSLFTNICQRREGNSAIMPLCGFVCSNPKLPCVTGCCWVSPELGSEFQSLLCFLWNLQMNLVVSEQGPELRAPEKQCDYHNLFSSLFIFFASTQLSFLCVPFFYTMSQSLNWCSCAMLMYAFLIYIFFSKAR